MRLMPISGHDLQVRSYGLVNTNGKSGDLATGVQFTLLSGGGTGWGTEASVSADPGRKLLSEQQHRHLLRGQVTNPLSTGHPLLSETVKMAGILPKVPCFQKGREPPGQSEVSLEIRICRTK